MKREDIEKAAQDYEDDLIYSSLSEQYDVQKAFVKGADWRINSVWHDTKDIPKPITILVMRLDGSCLKYFFTTIFHWRSFVKRDKIIKWAYLDDLLPNTEE